MTLRRFFVAFTAVFAGALSIEVFNYHQIATIEKDRWAMIPELSGSLLLFAALFVLAWPRRTSIVLFAACCAVSIAVGLAGMAFHFSSHALVPRNLGNVTSWLGNPPPLAPLEFAAVGLLGLLAVAWEGGGTLALPQIPFAASACYSLGALVSLTALILAALSVRTEAVLAVVAALVIGAVAYVVELSAPTGDRAT